MSAEKTVPLRKSGFGRMLRRAIPSRTRRTLRVLLTETPVRLRDGLADLLDALGVYSSNGRLPPPSLRRRVARTSSRREFLEVGRRVARDLRGVFDETRQPAEAYGRWLDFGCGAGRVSRFVAEFPFVESLCGIDVDEEAILWSRGHLRRGTYVHVLEASLLPFSDESFDVVFAISVFSHLDEESQRLWLREIHRVLRAGGLFLASTHSEKLRYSRPDLTLEQHRRLNERGFLFAPGSGPFRSDSTFHSRHYLKQEWGKLFSIRSHHEDGLAGFQDLSVWERPPSQSLTV
jgi:SAM-dependent methyltransferase